MFSDVEIKLKKRNKLLFSRESQCLQELIKLIQLQNHRTVVMWALDWAVFLIDDTKPNKERLLKEKRGVKP